ncbi:MAG: hypothetical protein Q9200_003617, partial [Gallowayella weberi]
YGSFTNDTAHICNAVFAPYVCNAQFMTSGMATPPAPMPAKVVPGNGQRGLDRRVDRGTKG